METIEASGRTLEEAVQVAAAELGVSTDAVDYEVLEEGSKGFLGLGQLPCMIRAKIREGYQAAPKPAPQPEPEEAGEYREEAEEVEVTADTQAGEESVAGGTFEDCLITVLNDVLRAMHLDAKPVVRSSEDDEVVAEIEGRDLGILIGKKGETLDALQYLISIAASKISGEKKRVILDAEGFRDRHRVMLEKIAHQYADAVKEQGQEAELEPQSARDRRIVHMALADDPDVYTYSEGEGDYRHVVISPKK